MAKNRDQRSDDDNDDDDEIQYVSAQPPMPGDAALAMDEDQPGPSGENPNDPMLSEPVVPVETDDEDSPAEKNWENYKDSDLGKERDVKDAGTARSEQRKATDAKPGSEGAESRAAQARTAQPARPQTSKPASS